MGIQSRVDGYFDGNFEMARVNWSLKPADPDMMDDNNMDRHRMMESEVNLFTQKYSDIFRNANKTPYSMESQSTYTSK